MAYQIDQNAIDAMKKAGDVNYDIAEDILKEIAILMNAFDKEANAVVSDHIRDYRELLEECRALCNVIFGNVTGTAEKTKTLAKAYDNVLSRRLR